MITSAYSVLARWAILSGFSTLCCF